MKLWQSLMDNWSYLTFRAYHFKIKTKDHAMRVLEEALELAQSEGVTQEEAQQIQAQVFAKAAGNPSQELGGVLVCLAGYAQTAGLDLEDSFWSEYKRICDPVIMEQVFRRNIGGDKIGIEVDPTIGRKPFVVLGETEGNYMELTFGTDEDGALTVKRDPVTLQSLDNLLQEEGILEEVTAVATQRIASGKPLDIRQVTEDDMIILDPHAETYEDLVVGETYLVFADFRVFYGTTLTVTTEVDFRWRMSVSFHQRLRLAAILKPISSGTPLRVKVICVENDDGAKSIEVVDVSVRSPT